MLRSSPVLWHIHHLHSGTECRNCCPARPQHRLYRRRHGTFGDWLEAFEALKWQSFGVSKESGYSRSATNSVTSCLHCHQHCQQFIKFYSFWIVFFQVAMEVLHLGHLFLTFLELCLSTPWNPKVPLKSAQEHGKSWKIGAFDVDPEAFHIHLAPLRSSFPEMTSSHTCIVKDTPIEDSKLVLECPRYKALQTYQLSSFHCRCPTNLGASGHKPGMHCEILTGYSMDEFFLLFKHPPKTPLAFLTPCICLSATF